MQFFTTSRTDGTNLLYDLAMLQKRNRMAMTQYANAIDDLKIELISKPSPVRLANTEKLTIEKHDIAYKDMSLYSENEFVKNWNDNVDIEKDRVEIGVSVDTTRQNFNYRSSMSIVPIHNKWIADNHVRFVDFVHIKTDLQNQPFNYTTPAIMRVVSDDNIRAFQGLYAADDDDFLSAHVGHCFNFLRCIGRNNPKDVWLRLIKSREIKSQSDFDPKNALKKKVNTVKDNTPSLQEIQVEMDNNAASSTSSGDNENIDANISFNVSDRVEFRKTSKKVADGDVETVTTEQIVWVDFKTPLYLGKEGKLSYSYKDNVFTPTDLTNKFTVLSMKATVTITSVFYRTYRYSEGQNTDHGILLQQQVLCHLDYTFAENLNFSNFSNIGLKIHLTNIGSSEENTKSMSAFAWLFGDGIPVAMSVQQYGPGDNDTKSLKPTISTKNFQSEEYNFSCFGRPMASEITFSKLYFTLLEYLKTKPGNVAINGLDKTINKDNFLKHVFKNFNNVRDDSAYPNDIDTQYTSNSAIISYIKDKKILLETDKAQSLMVASAFGILCEDFDAFMNIKVWIPPKKKLLMVSFVKDEEDGIENVQGDDDTASDRPGLEKIRPNAARFDTSLDMDEILRSAKLPSIYDF